MKIPEEFENHYERDVVLRFKRTIFGLKQAAYAFWREFLKAFVALGYTRSEADPSLYYKWDNEGLILWISWVDDCLVTAQEKDSKCYCYRVFDISPTIYNCLHAQARR